MMTDDTTRVRLDKWLWAARFFKTRALATEAINGGKVHADGQRVKPGRGVKPGDVLTITQGRFEKTVTVLGLSARRGPASQAQQLYEEAAESRERRERLLEQERLARASSPPQVRPDKHARRHIRRLKQHQ